VLVCEEMGIDTGVDLDALIEVGRMAEAIVGHQLPGELIHAGRLPAGAVGGRDLHPLEKRLVTAHVGSGPEPRRDQSAHTSIEGSPSSIGR
jgi:hypothetical protein